MEIFRNIAFALLMLSSLAVNAFAEEPAELLANIRRTVMSPPGTARLTGYTNEFAYAKVDSGSFAEGDLISIYTESGGVRKDIAVGEVVFVSNGDIRMVVTTHLPKLAVGMGVSRPKFLRIFLSGDDVDRVTAALKQEKDFTVTDKPGDDVHLRVTIKSKDACLGYSAVSSATGKIVKLGCVNKVNKAEKPPQ